MMETKRLLNEVSSDKIYPGQKIFVHDGREIVSAEVTRKTKRRLYLSGWVLGAYGRDEFFIPITPSRIYAVTLEAAQHRLDEYFRKGIEWHKERAAELEEEYEKFKEGFDGKEGG